MTTTLPSGSLLYIGPLSSTGTFTITGQLTAPRPLPASADEEMLRFVSLDTVSVLDAARIPLPDWASPVIVAEDHGVPSRQQPPLLFVGEPGGRRTAVLAFDLRRSDLPLQVAFPVLFANLVDWLAPGRSGALPQAVAPGDVLSFSVPADSAASEITVTRPDGTRLALPVADGRVTIPETGQLGVYRLDLGGSQPLLYAVNLFSPQESAIARLDSLPVESTVAAGVNSLQDGAEREWWRLLALLALILLFVEWLVYHRPALTRIRQEILARRS
jgi:hypothetical protein